jgi:Dolichyl-phosphate-mannose-protein mannosyltransferase
MSNGVGASSARTEKLSFGAMVLFVLLGAALRVGQYSMGSAMWVDELAVARNLVDRSLGALLTAPLSYDQVAPPGFLLVEKLALAVLGPSEYALRLFPLVGGLASLVLFALLARRVLSASGAAIAVGLFALSPPLVGFAVQLKPYATDVALAILLTLAALDWWDHRVARSSVPLGVVGFVVAWFSIPALLVLGGLLLALGAASLQDKLGGSIRRLAPAAALWTTGALGIAVVTFVTTSPSTRVFMRAYWQDGFPPLPQSLRDGFWVVRTFTSLVGGQLGYEWPLLLVAAAIVGVVSLWRRHRLAAQMLALPIALAILAAAVRAYPLDGRLALWVLPAIVMAIGECAARAGDALGRHVPYASVLVAGVLAVLPARAIARTYPFYQKEEMRTVLAYVRDHRQPGDAVYVYFGAVPAVAFYGPRYGIQPDEVTVGRCHRPELQRYFSELDAFRGRPRVWLVMSHTSPPQLGEREMLRSYLSTIGAVRDSIITHLARGPLPSASAYLYDLSDAATLARASARDFAVLLQSSPPPGMASAALHCTGGPTGPDNY